LKRLAVATRPRLVLVELVPMELVRVPTTSVLPNVNNVGLHSC
jgi:hypothetical protein